MTYAIASLGEMPQHASGINNVSNAKSPGLHGGWFGSWHTEAIGKIKQVDMRPPCIQVVHHQLHHEIACPIFLKMTLKQKASASRSEDGDLGIERFFEPQRLVESFGEFKVLCWQKRTSEFGSSNHAIQIPFFEYRYAGIINQRRLNVQLHQAQLSLDAV